MAKAEKYSDKWQLPLCTKAIVLVTHNLKYNFNTSYQLKHNTLYGLINSFNIFAMYEIYEIHILYKSLSIRTKYQFENDDQA